eukprot:snap_masked-scaffold_13-processed-gene-1.33-mRNA-1 protein AED:1.00 eAED:1.00 QI:0/0/0/0/1/1/2/0/78
MKQYIALKMQFARGNVIANQKNIETDSNSLVMRNSTSKDNEIVSDHSEITTVTNEYTSHRFQVFLQLAILSLNATLMH